MAPGAERHRAARSRRIAAPGPALPRRPPAEISSAPHRPLFLLTGLAALAAPAVWLWPDPVAVADPVWWHLHELIFAMVGAAIGGYLLTALPHWSGHRIGQRTLCWLLAAWLAGRPGPLLPAAPAGLVLAAAASYPALLSFVLLRAILRARCWRRLPLGLVPLALGAADGVAVSARAAGDLPAAAPLAIVLGLALLIGAIGGRAIPAFIQSWLTRRADPGRIRAPGWIAALTFATGTAAIGLLLAGQDRPAGALLIVTGAAQLGRMAGWRVRRALTSAALAMLLAAWGWLGLGLILTGIALVRPAVIAPADALHGLSMGAMGAMIIAIGGRATMRREAGGLVPTPALVAAFALVWLSAALRVAAAWLALGPADPAALAAAVWIAGWGLFLAALLRGWRGPAPNPVLSARQAP